jgi:myosin-5
LKQEINKLAVPAIIETESLPGFASGSQKGFLSRFLASAPPPAANTQDLLNFMSKTLRALKYYYVHEKIILSIMQELLRLMGVISFNHLLVRRNFSTWKRGTFYKLHSF